MKSANLEVEQISTNEIRDLIEVLKKSNEATIFHTVEWSNILSEVFETKVFVSMLTFPLCYIFSS
jgi:hypothetical protein